MNRLSITILSTCCILTCAQCSNLQHIFENPNNKPIKVTEEVPQDREYVSIEDDKQFSSADLEKGVIRGDWAIEKVLDKKAKGEYPPFIKFSQQDKNIYGNNGCNVINGKYNYNPADSTLQITDIITTMRFCSTSGITDHEINLALDNTRYYTMTKIDSRYYLNLYDSMRMPLMTLMHQNFEFLNGAWSVREIEGQNTEKDDIQLVFDIDEMKVHGNTSCNIINGSLATDLETANSISFQNLATTRMSCEDISKENALLVALEEAMYVEPVDNNNINLLDSRNRIVLSLTRIN